MSTQSSENEARVAREQKRAIDCLRLPPNLTVSDWADAHRFLTSEAASREGKWESFPYQREPMDAVLDPEITEVCMMWASQVGKTEVLNNIVGYHIDQVPCPILMLQPTVEMAGAWSKDRLAPMTRQTPRLKGLVKDPKTRDSNNTILHKGFPGGHISMVGANSPAGLAMRPIRVLLCDEIDRYPASAGSEGDPIVLAQKRTDTFWDAVVVKTSTPTVYRVSPIEKEFEQSDKRYWFCPCPKCREYQTLVWSQVKWDKGANGEHKPESARYICIRCKAELNDGDRVKMIHAGEWRATAKFNGIRGYHLNGIYTLFRHQKGFRNRLHQMAHNFLTKTARGEEGVKALTNTFFAETYKPKLITMKKSDIMLRAEKYGPELPQPVLCLVGSADLQIDRIEYHVVGFGEGEEAWAIDYRILPGNPHRIEVWKELGKAIDAIYTHANGHKMKAAITFIDSGGQSGRAGFAKDVYRFVRNRQMAGYGFGCWASKGSSVRGAPLRKESRQKNGVFLQMIGTDEAKSMVYDRLNIKEPGPRYLHFSDDPKFDSEYYEQLTAEEVRIRKEKGFDVRDWYKLRDRNEVLDLWAMAFAALDKLNPSWAKLKARYGVKVGDRAEYGGGDEVKHEPASKRERIRALKPRRHMPFRKR